MLRNVYDILCDRGFIFQTTGEQEVRSLLGDSVVCYVGFDPTATSLHVGSLIPIMALAHMQKSGHEVIVLVGGATALVGDPSGKREMRPALSQETVGQNALRIGAQLSRFIAFGEGGARLMNNADWLGRLEYIPFLRDIGKHFSVNRMLTSDSCRTRLETGLSFIEFNYALLQAYDFLHLYNTEGCVLQMGGSDQWGNIVAGIELVRRVNGGRAHGVTFPLITTSSGHKMGKTAEGAVWLDPSRTSPYEYYQYWVNADDRDVLRFAALFTYLPMAEVRDLEGLEGADLNSAKVVLAYEATCIAHGEEEANRAYAEACRLFASRDIPSNVFPSSRLHDVRKFAGVKQSMSDGPCSVMALEELAVGIPVFKIFNNVGLVNSSGEARRLINQGGAYVNGRRVDSIDEIVSDSDICDGQILLRSGKKKYHCIQIKG